MKSIRRLTPVLLLLVGIVYLSACGSPTVEVEEVANAEHSHEGDHTHEDEHTHEDDHDHANGGHIHVDPPEEFAELSNPFAGDAEAIAAGKIIFETNCMTCHGPEGKGDGEAAIGLDPAPANLADAEMMGTIDDAYLFWRVSKGGALEPFNSVMPTWEQSLTEEERWQVVSYVRTFSQN